MKWKQHRISVVLCACSFKKLLHPKFQCHRHCIGTSKIVEFYLRSDSLLQSALLKCSLTTNSMSTILRIFPESRIRYSIKYEKALNVFNTSLKMTSRYLGDFYYLFLFLFTSRCESRMLCWVPTFSRCWQTHRKHFGILIFVSFSILI